MSTATWKYHYDRANTFFGRYVELQTEIEWMEERALKSMGGNRQSAKLALRDDIDLRFHHKSGRVYAQMTALRDNYMAVAQLSASMALMIQRA